MQGVSAQFPCTWEEVLDFRRDHVGPPEQVSKALQGSVGKVKNDFHELCTLPSTGCQGSGLHEKPAAIPAPAAAAAEEPLRRVPNLRSQLNQRNLHTPTEPLPATHFPTLLWRQLKRRI